MIPLKIALRFLKSSKFQTILIVLGIAVGVSVQIFVGSLITSLQDNLTNELLGNASHITILPQDKDGTIEDWENIVVEIENVPGITAVSPSISTTAITARGESSNYLFLRGVNMERAEGIYGLGEKMQSGTVPSWGEVAIGTRLAEEFSMGLGDSLSIVLLTSENATTFSFNISGIFEFGSSNLDLNWAFIDISTMQNILSLGNVVTSIETQIMVVEDSEIIQSEMEKILGTESIRVTNWKEENEQFLSALQAQSGSSYMIQVFVLLSVLIGISSVLAISVVQKSRQLGILKAMGIKDKQASLIFLFQGLLLGAAGSTVGVLLGIGLLKGFEQGAGLFTIAIKPEFLLFSAVIATIASTAAALAPARRSSKLEPMEVIRNG